MYYCSVFLIVQICFLDTNNRNKSEKIIFTPHKFQFANNSPLLFTVQWKTLDKSAGNQIPRRGLDVYAMKIEFTAVKMF